MSYRRNFLVCISYGFSFIHLSVHSFMSTSADSRRAVVSDWWKYVLVNHLGDLSLPRNNVV